MTPTAIPAEILLQHSQDGMFVIVDERLVHGNEVLARMRGTTVESMIGADIYDLIAPDQRAAAHERQRRRAAGEAVPTQYENCLLHADGVTRIPVLMSASRIPDGPWAGALVGTVKDLTQIRHALNTAEQRHAEIEKILEGLPDTYYRTNAQGVVTFATQTTMDIFGLPRDEMIGKPLASFYVTPEERTVVVQKILAAKGDYVLVEARVKRADGGISWASTRARALFDADGKFAGVEGSGRDISQRIYMEQALQDSLRQIEARERAKTRFLAAASHDLRQPIQAAQLFLHALRRSSLDANQSKISEQLETSVQSLSELLDALLDISRLDAGVMAPQPLRVEASELLSRLDTEFSPLVLAKGLRFKLWFPGAPLVLATDPRLLGALLRNLVANAVTYTQRGGILVSARQRDGHVLIQVWDTGVGIAAGQFEQIFEEFYQIANVERNRKKGLGLGLAIVRRIAALLGVDVCVRSSPGHGSVFEARVPLYDPGRHGLLAAAPAPAGPPETDARLQGADVMIVEDDDQVANSIGAWLHTLGARMHRYPLAEAALAMGDFDAIDYIVTDYRLPGKLNGIDFLEQAQRRARHPLRAVIITGDTSPALVEQFRQQSWPVLFKPFAPERLAATLANYPAPPGLTSRGGD